MHTYDDDCAVRVSSFVPVRGVSFRAFRVLTIYHVLCGAFFCQRHANGAGTCDRIFFHVAFPRIRFILFIARAHAPRAVNRPRAGGAGVAWEACEAGLNERENGAAIVVRSANKEGTGYSFCHSCHDGDIP